MTSAFLRNSCRFFYFMEVLLCYYHLQLFFLLDFLRQIALIIILIKAGLSLNLSDLKKVGRPAVMLSCVPACFEIVGKLWISAEVMLFVLVGAAVDVRYTLTAGITTVGIIFIALTFRAAGVFLCMLGTQLTAKERLFCIIAYLPKATVQAAIGSVPLSIGLPCGKIVLSVAVLAILITAPLGAIGIDKSYSKLLSYDK